MKRKGSTSDFLVQRDRELLARFREELADSRGVALRDMFGLAARRPASRFWVAEERAAEVVSRMKRGDRLEESPEMKRRMYEEIYRRVEAWEREHPGRPLSEAVCEVVNSPAPEFYLTEKSARVIIYRLRRRANIPSA